MTHIPGEPTTTENVNALFHRIPIRYYGWATVKLLIVVWLVRYNLVTPIATANTLGITLAYGSFVAIVGIATSMVGMVLSAWPSPKTQLRGPIFEVIGLLLALAGPLLYAFAMLTIWTQGIVENSQGREGPFWMSCIIAAILMVRIIEVWPRYWRPRSLKRK